MSKRSEVLLLEYKKTTFLLQRWDYVFIVLHCFGLDGGNDQRWHAFICATFSTFSNTDFSPQGCERGQRVLGVLYSPQFSGRALSPAAASSGSTMWGRCSRWGRRDFWPRGPRCGWHLRAHMNPTSVMCSKLWSWLVHTHTHTACQCWLMSQNCAGTTK